MYAICNMFHLSLSIMLMWCSHWWFWARNGQNLAQKLFYQITLMITISIFYMSRHSIISPCIQTMDLHGLQTHEWVLWCLWAVILGQKWAKFGILTDQHQNFSIRHSWPPCTIHMSQTIQSSPHASKPWICMAYRHMNDCCAVFGQWFWVRNGQNSASQPQFKK